MRTIESVIDVPGWAPVTPYLNMANSVPTSQVNVLLIWKILRKALMIHISQEELKAILSEAKTNPNMQYITAGVGYNMEFPNHPLKSSPAGDYLS